MWKGIIKIVTENTVYNKKMLAEEGLSILVEEISPEPTKILIDTGRTYSTITHNLRVMNEDPKKIDVIIATHGHAGHIQALNDFIKDTNMPNLILNPKIFDEKYKKKSEIISPGGVNLDRTYLQKFSKLIEVDTPYQITKNIWTSGNIYISEKLELGESEKGKYWKKVQKELVPDFFDEETAVFINSNLGVIALTACGHRGIANIAEAGKKVLSAKKIAAVIGGFHTMDRPEIIPILIKRLSSNKTHSVLPCHCTGLQGKIAFAKQWEGNFIDVSTGTIIEVEDRIVVK